MALVLILPGTGVFSNVTCFVLTYKVLIPKYSFERCTADYGQPMGTTSIRLISLNPEISRLLVEMKDKTDVYALMLPWP